MCADADKTLLERCLEHDRAAWDRFVERYSRLIYSVVYKTLRRHAGGAGEELVDELFHAAFLALYDNNYRKLRQWSGRCSLASWIRLVTASVVVDHLRRRRSDRSIDDLEVLALPDVLVDASTPEHHLQRLERVARVREAMEALTPPDRELLLVLFRDDVSPGAAAEAMGVTAGALYTRKNRALARLKQAYDELDD